MSIKRLFTPLRIRGVEFPNRVWVSPMCQYSANEGVIGEWHLAHLGSFATGGVGLIMVEATGVMPSGRISIGCAGIWNDEQGEAFKPVVDFAHSQGVKIGIQLAHAGRKGSTMRPWDDHPFATLEEGGWETIAPSAIPFGDYPMPHALTLEEIKDVQERFVDAAIRAERTGFDLVEIHAAHGYLIHQFLSPLSNTREDHYGGSFVNRTRLLVEIATKVRGAIKESMPLFVRISATDWMDGGWSLEESIELAKILKDVGVDLIDVSSGGLVHNSKLKTGPGYQVPFANAIKEGSSILTASVGQITEAHQAEEIIASGKSDAVMLGRAMLRNPRWAFAAAEELGINIAIPEQLERARTLPKS